MARFYNPLARIFFLLESILAGQEKERSRMSALSDAVSVLTATTQATHQEVGLVLAAVRDFPAKIQAAIDQALANGASADDLAGIKAANDSLAADTQSMVDALAATPPANP